MAILTEYQASCLTLVIKPTEQTIPKVRISSKFAVYVINPQVFPYYVSDFKNA